MRALAEVWTCDASNATWMVDRLEGEKTRAGLIEAPYEPPPELLELDRADLEALRDAVAKLPRPTEG